MRSSARVRIGAEERLGGGRAAGKLETEEKEDEDECLWIWKDEDDVECASVLRKGKR